MFLCSGNIVINVKRVISLGTVGFIGIEAATSHRSRRQLPVVGLLGSDEPLRILFYYEGASRSAKVEIKVSHTNIVIRCLDGA